MIPDDLIITRRSSQKQICRVTTEALVQSNTLFAIDTISLKALPQWLYFDCLSYDGFIYDGPTYEGQTKCFSLQNLSRFLNKSAINQLQTTLAKRLQKTEPVCIDYQPGKQEWLWSTKSPS